MLCSLRVLVSGHLFNSTTTQVILSVPIPDEDRMSDAQIWSKISSMQLVIGSLFCFFSFSLLRICSAPSSDVRQSQMPSQASIRNWSFCYLAVLVTSGSTVTICSLKSFEVLDLYSKSPIERDRFRLPFTLFSSTKPPAAIILFFSSSLSGL